ncbi:acetyl-CoA synthetase [Candidatus Woesearchaeota archaeon CG10_big_fil_rev_8_21_14_0_10_34_8]|nr:MAG: acetyl-CoA synthetase [Candidatus Woesearchaeota archaeon CG10_big_fil_rev_8_21_14_0_10_34_8]
MNHINLDQKDVFLILQDASFPISRILLAENEEQAVENGKSLGFPLVMKIDSPEISHKSDCGGVKTGIQNEGELRLSYRQVMHDAHTAYPQATLHGVLLQKMENGREIIIGAKKDPTFGHMIMFGLGGIMVEVMKDVSFRISPLKESDAMEMIQEIKGYAILKGTRGEKSVDIKSLTTILLLLSDLLSKKPEISELDFNPVMVSEHGAIIVDARISL